MSPDPKRGSQRAVPGTVAVLLLCLALAGLAACSEGGSGTPVPGLGYFPLAEGAVWKYELRTAAGALKLEVTARGEMELPDGGGEAFVMDERNLGPSMGFEETAPVAYRVEGGYVSQIKAVGYDSQGQLRLLGQSQPTRILPIDPVAGQAWGQDHSLFDTPEGGGAEIGWSSDVIGQTQVTVPAGTFDVVEVASRYYDGHDRDLAPKVLYRDFYAKGVGLVRSLAEDPSGDASHTIEQVLLSYRFPAP